MKKLSRFFALSLALLTFVFAQATTVREIPTKHIPGPAKVTVAVPADYEMHPTRSYPTVYMLNGHGGDHRSWGSIVNLDSLATVHEIIIVCPAGLNSWYFDSPVNPAMKMESYVTKDLVPWVDANYRTKANPHERAITGLSMGGHGALWLAFRHPELFLNAGSTSGGVDFTHWPNKWNLADALGSYEKNKKRWSDHTVLSLVPSLTPGRYNIIFDCGTEDFFFKVNNNLHDAMTKRGIVHEYLNYPGGHTSAYWKHSIVPQLDFFSRHFQQAAK